MFFQEVLEMREGIRKEGLGMVIFMSTMPSDRHSQWNFVFCSAERSRTYYGAHNLE